MKEKNLLIKNFELLMIWSTRQVPKQQRTIQTKSDTNAQNQTVISRFSRRIQKRKTRRRSLPLISSRHNPLKMILMTDCLKSKKCLKPLFLQSRTSTRCNFDRNFIVKIKLQKLQRMSKSKRKLSYFLNKDRLRLFLLITMKNIHSIQDIIFDR